MIVSAATGQVDTPMASSLKPFPISHSDQSPYFSAYPAIAEQNQTETKARLINADRPAKVARALVDVAERRNPAGKVWVGTGARMLRWIRPVLPIWAVDEIRRKILHTDNVETPVFYLICS